MTRQIPLPLPHDTAMGADDFMVTACNRDAAMWVERWPDWPAPGLVVTGPAGSGKTHLLHLWQSKTGGDILSLRQLHDTEFVQLSALACLAVDDGDALASDATAQEKLFHLYNRNITKRGWLVIALSTSDGISHFTLPDLRSRLLTLPVVRLGAPDDELLQGLMIKQFRDRQITPDRGVVDYLLPRIKRDAAAIRDIVERLDQASLAQTRKISIALARQILEETIVVADPSPILPDIDP